MAKKTSEQPHKPAHETGEKPPSTATEPAPNGSSASNQAGGRYDGYSHKVSAVRAIRNDLKARGTEPTTKEVYEVYKETKWTLGDHDKDCNYLSSTLTQLRKEDAGIPARAAKRIQGRVVQPTTEPALADLLRVKALAKQHGGLAAITEMMGKLATLADEVGGFDRLRLCLDALQLLSRE